jgi:hypothetical protein
MIWLPDGDEIIDREKHMIQSPKLMLPFVWNPHGFQVVDVMPCHAMPCQIERFSRPPTISEMFSPRSLLGVERGDRTSVVHVDNIRPRTAKVPRPFCDDKFLRIALHPRPPSWPDLVPSDFFLFGNLKKCLQGQQAGLQINFFRESKKLWTKSALALCKRFSGSGSIDWTHSLQQNRK